MCNVDATSYSARCMLSRAVGKLVCFLEETKLSTFVFLRGDRIIKVFVVILLSVCESVVKPLQGNVGKSLAV